MKVFFLRPYEDWIVDRFAEEFKEASRHDVTFSDVDSADVVWLAAEWCYNRLSSDILQNKPVLCTIHHKFKPKWSDSAAREFLVRDETVDMYHVPCDSTYDWPMSLVKNREDRVKKIGYWFDHRKWPQVDRVESKRILGINVDSFVIGSFQRDTEGHDLISPKLEKGPDILCDFLERYHTQRPGFVVLLNTWRRNYVMSRLYNAGIDFFTKTVESQSDLSLMYSACDLYLVTARAEGGPMAILECAIKHVPIISSDVGVARDILHGDCIKDLSMCSNIELPSSTHIEYAHERVQQFELKNIVKRYDDLIDSTFYNSKKRK